MKKEYQKAEVKVFEILESATLLDNTSYYKFTYEIEDDEDDYIDDNKSGVQSL